MTKINRNVVIAVAILAAVALIATVVVLVKGSSKDEPPVAQQPSETTTQQAPPSGENYPGAMVGNTQRTWPDPSGDLDDTPHAEPGTYSADWMKQQPVWTPRNHDGDLPKKESLKEGMDKCDKGEVSLEGKTQQQYVNARYLVVNDQAGPSRLDKGVPRGYAHSPQGAVVAAMNLAGYGVYAQGDGIGQEIDKALWTTSKTAQEKRQSLALDSSSQRDLENSRAIMHPGADKFSVKTCSPNLVVVEVAFTEGEATKSNPDSEGDLVFRVPMFWRDGDWKPDFSGSADDMMVVQNADLSSYKKVVYQ
ncbi:hypothetical protein [Corynebacterium auriscanis]|uniref:hypothetical protein n=1 Tax=Corynebacterium auriscanis TaxID=99807 RepID=UPI003CF1F331